MPTTSSHPKKKSPARPAADPRSAAPGGPTSQPAGAPPPPAPRSTAKTASMDAYRENADDQALTTNTDVKIEDDQNSLRVGVRGPTLIEDFLLREKITHFDHEREREAPSQGRSVRQPESGCRDRSR